MSVGTAGLVDLPQSYRLLLCDIWGCVHDGVHLFPGAEALMLAWRRQGRIVLLITNAPRPASAVQAQLDRLGLDRESHDAIVTSGDTGLAALRAEGRNQAGFIGTAADRRIIEQTGFRLADGPVGDAVICTGLVDGALDAAAHDEALKAMLARDARLLCFNPDRIVMRGGVAEPCAGVIADRYAAMGGEVQWFGKPYPAIYRRALEIGRALADAPIESDHVAAIGDSIATDFVGAAAAGFAFVFVTGGIEGERVSEEGTDALLARFAAERDVVLPRPLAVVPRLG